jgi:hypothetical protein
MQLTSEIRLFLTPPTMPTNTGDSFEFEECFHWGIFTIKKVLKRNHSWKAS